MLKTDYKQGDIIEFCGDQFEIITNHGYSGIVKEYFGEHGYGDTISNFHWEYDGVCCKLIKSV